MSAEQEELSKIILPIFENLINQLRYNPELFKLVMYFEGHSRLTKKIVKQEKVTLIAYAGANEKSMPLDGFVSDLCYGGNACNNLSLERTGLPG